MTIAPRKTKKGKKRAINLWPRIVLAVIPGLFIAGIVFGLPERITFSVKRLFRFSGDAPQIISASVEPNKVRPGDTMIVTAGIKDSYGIKEVKADMGGIETIDLELTEGTEKNGKWQEKWRVHDVGVGEYITTITATNILGHSSQVKVTWTDDPGWLSGWQYRRAITIDNSSNTSTLTNYQVKVSLDSTNFDFGKANSDGSDIRFTDSDGTTLIDFWIESWDSTGQTATLWIEVPSIPASSTATIYMYYGNSSAASASSINDTALESVGDDFDPDKINWSVVAGTWSNEAGYQGNSKKGVHNGTAGYRKALAGPQMTSADFILQAKVRSTVDDSLANIVFRAADNSNDGNDRIWVRLDQRAVQSGHYGGFHLFEDVGGAEYVRGYYDFAPTVGQWYDVMVKVHGSTVEGYLDGTLEWTATVSKTTAGYLLLQVEYLSGHDAWFDNLFVRKYTSPEPTTSVGSEETSNTAPDAPTSLAQYKSDCSTQIPTGGWTNETSVCLKGYINDPDTNDNVKLQIDYTTGTFDNVPDATSTNWCTDPCTASTTISGLIHGSEYKWQARSIDDDNATSTWAQFNSGNIAFKIDTQNPTSSVDSLPSWQTSTSWTVSWSGNDADSGIDHYDLQYQKNSGTWTDCITNTTSTSITFPTDCSSPPPVSDGDNFGFRVRAQDVAGNQESYPDTADATTSVDTSAPSCSISSISETSSYAYVSGTQIYYNNQTSGSFTVDVSASDSHSGIQKVNFPDTVSAGGDDTTSPYSWDYNWDTNDTYSQQATVTCYNNANLTSNSNFTVTLDTTPPSGGSITYNDGYYTTPSVSITVNDGTDSGAGIDTSSRIIERKEAVLSNGSCGTFGAFSDITSSLSGSYPNYTDDTVVSGKCYQYRYRVKDNVSNEVIYESSNTAKIDASPPSGGSISYTDGCSTSTSVEITLNDGTDSESGIDTSSRELQRREATLSGGTCGSFGSWTTIATSTSVGYPTHTDTGLSSNTCYQYRYLVSDNAGNIATYSTSNNLKVDYTAPTGLNSLNVTSTGANSVSLSWSEVVEENFDHYEIWYGTNQSDVENRTGSAQEWDQDNDSNLSSKSTTSTTISGLSPDTTYYFKIWAQDICANEETVSTVSATTQSRRWILQGVIMQGITGWSQ